MIEKERERESEERVELCDSSEDLLLSRASEKFQFNWMHPHYEQPSDLKPEPYQGRRHVNLIGADLITARRRTRNRAGHLATISNWKNIHTYIIYILYIYFYPASNWMLISDSTALPACRAPLSMLSWKGFVWVYPIPFCAVSYFRPKIMAKASSACDTLSVCVWEREYIIIYHIKLV